MNYVKKYFLIVVAALAMVPAPMSAGDRVVVHIDAQSYVKAKEAYKLERAKTNLFGLLILAGLVVIYDSRDKVQRHLRSAVDFVKKHKTKIICGVLAVAALATGYCYRDEVWEFFSPGEPKFATDNFRLDN